MGHIQVLSSLHAYNILLKVTITGKIIISLIPKFFSFLRSILNWNEQNGHTLQININILLTLLLYPPLTQIWKVWQLSIYYNEFNRHACMQCECRVKLKKSKIYYNFFTLYFVTITPFGNAYTWIWSAS